MNATAGVIRNAQVGFVYFVQSGDRPFVKIGWTVDPDYRLQQLQCGNPDRLQLLGLVPGTLADEAAWHTRFANAFYRGEWFHLTSGVSTDISNKDAIALSMLHDANKVVDKDWIDQRIEMIRDSRTLIRSKAKSASAHFLDAEKVKSIFSDSRSIRKIAADYQIGVMTVHNIKSGRSWRYITGAEKPKRTARIARTARQDRIAA